MNVFQKVSDLQQKRSFSIMQICSSDDGGGAEKVAWNLHQTYKELGHTSWLAVKTKRRLSSDVLIMNSNLYRNGWARLWVRLGELLAAKVNDSSQADQVRWRAQLIGQVGRFWKIWRGHEDFDYPATWHLLNLPPERPDVIHCHNLHGGYFDLTVLPWLSRQLPVVLTLHDAWLLSGHCAHSFACERWKIGCGHCPDLATYPPVWRDATAYNWQRKQILYAQSRLYVATPSNWLMEKVKQSILTRGIVETRVIPNGLNLSLFKPAEKQIARHTLNLNSTAKILLFTANNIRSNPWKDYPTMRTVISMVAELLPNEIIFLALGEDGPSEQIGQAHIKFVPYQKEPETVARYYQAADLYLHAARVDTFPNTILEALACGTPVVASAVGGIPEQVKGLAFAENQVSKNGLSLNSYGLEEATGMLTPPGDAEAMANAIVLLLTNERYQQQLSHNAVLEAQHRFDLKHQTKVYLTWYQEMVTHHLDESPRRVPLTN